MRAIRLTPDETPIDIVIHTPGGIALAAVQIAYALDAHPTRTTVMVPHYAMSGGTLIALAADEIMMDPHAVLGPVDPQLGDASGVYPATSILKVVERKSVDEIDDRTLILAEESRKAVATYAGKMKGHLLLVHGMADDNVQLQNTLEVVDALQENDKQFDLMLYHGCDHGLRGGNTQQHLFRLMDEYFQRHL